MRVLRPLLPVVVLLAACGQTGPLVLPEQPLTAPSSPPVVVPTTPQDVPDDESRRPADNVSPAGKTADTH